uniref:Partial AB-hydrolase lipase domain-containing protein n=1 Tax=Anopheles maculatus TaxID=74869 RepID=A0A182SB68_9DIPT
MPEQQLLMTTVVWRLIVVLFLVYRPTSSAFSGTHDKVELTTTVLTTPATVWKRPPIAYDRDLVIELIEAADYPIEKHVLTTSDGYILKLHRIPDPVQFPSAEQPITTNNDPDELLRFTPNKTFRGTVLLVPGLFSTAADFVVTGPENGLAFVLADAGYDVWLANVRGSRFSRKNVKLSVTDSEFWDFR